MAQKTNVLCVLSEEQYADYQPELSTLATTGANLVLEASTDVALAHAPNFEPVLMIVGMELGTMEGFEFMAYLANRHPDLQVPLVLLPDKADDLRPVLHSRDYAAGTSDVREINFEGIAAFIEELLAPAAAPGAEDSAQLDETAVEAPPIATSVAPPRRSKAPIAIIAAVVIAGLAVGAYLVFGGGDGLAQTPAAAAAEPPPAETPPEPPARPAPAADQAPAAPAVAEPAEPAAIEVVLPLTFRRGSSTPSITDEDALEGIVTAAKESDSMIEIAGHTSADGETVENLQLGIQRARAAMQILVRRGVPPERFEIASRGERAPAASNETADGRRLNRRVTIEYRRTP